MTVAQRWELMERPGAHVSGPPARALYVLPDGRAVVTFDHGPPVGFRCWTCALRQTGSELAAGPFPVRVSFGPPPPLPS